MKWFEWLNGKATAEGVTLEDAPASFVETGLKPVSTADVKALVDAEVVKAVKAKELEFAETQRKEVERLGSREAEIQKREEILKKAESDRRKADIASFCEGLCKEGRLTPAMMKHGMGMENFLEAISGVVTTYEYSEGDKKGKQTPVEYAKAFLGSFK